LAAGARAPRLKCGSVRSTKPFWMRSPPTACCPTHAIICEMLMVEPFEPHDAMMSGLLYSHGSSRMHTLPASHTQPSPKPSRIIIV